MMDFSVIDPIDEWGQTMNLIMLCGQGSSGKSTFGAELIKKLNSTSKLIRMDNVDDTLPFSERMTVYLSNIQAAYDNKVENIIMDLAHDSIEFRNTVLSSLNFDNKYDSINFFAVSLRPEFEKIVEWEIKRKGYDELPKNQYFLMEKYYNRFQYPTEQEFKKFNFDTIVTLVVNNADFFESVNNVVQSIENKT